MDFEYVKKILLNDLRKFSLYNDEIFISFDNKEYTPSQLAYEIENNTDLGNKQVNNYILKINNIKKSYGIR